MIGEGQFQTMITACAGVLKKIKLLEEWNKSPNKSLGAAHFKGMTYRKVFEECIRMHAYDFKMNDQALILFTKSGTDEHDGVLGFCYYDCPFNVVSYEEFVAQECYGLSPDDPRFDAAVAEAGEAFRDDYSQYVTSQDSKAIVTPMRYDYKSSDYRPGAHPASHVHFGFANQIRVGTKKVMNPVSFTLFVIRQRYPACWERWLSGADAEVLCRNVRESLDAVHGNYWEKKDDHEVSLL
jgi:hypothetical protein